MAVDYTLLEQQLRALLAGVFDCDSPRLARFTDADRDGIERLVRAFSESLHSPRTAVR